MANPLPAFLLREEAVLLAATDIAAWGRLRRSMRVCLLSCGTTALDQDKGLGSTAANLMRQGRIRHFCDICLLVIAVQMACGRPSRRIRNVTAELPYRSYRARYSTMLFVCITPLLHASRCHAYQASKETPAVCDSALSSCDHSRNLTQLAANQSPFKHKRFDIITWILHPARRLSDRQPRRPRHTLTG
jgi:hypothetical protein